jgi:hypothetical protein
VNVEHGLGGRGHPGIGARAGEVVGEADRAGEHHLGHQGAVAVGARDEHAHVVGAVLVDPARAVEAQHLPGRGGGDHHIADVVDRGDVRNASIVSGGWSIPASSNQSQR